MNTEIDKRDIFIRGSKILLKALSEQDVYESGWYGWFNDEVATEFVQQHYFPNTVQKQLEFYRENIARSSTKIQLGIVPNGTATIVGVVSLSNIDFMNRKAEFGIMIGDASARGKGYGTEACFLMVKHGFERLSLNRIYLGVHAQHTAAIRSYEKVGFVREGILREDVLMNGRYIDTVIMSMLASDFRTLYSTSSGV
ncbi:MAG: GNAT family protein [Bacteroidota bacterium]|nr:GNAT family N-acetyltransferase [Candidatus Kapabacteria bacterium]MDW8219653.1 GNAT family protein [Bacteroidota bacterium]